MYETAQTVHPVQTVFGAGFFPENHIEDERRNLPATDSQFAEFVKSLRALVSDEFPKR